MAVNLTIPTNWNSLTQRQLQNIAYQLECYQEIIKDNASAIAMASTKLYTQLAKELLRGNKPLHIHTALNEIQPKAYAPWVQFLYQKVERTKFIPQVKVKGQVYYAPDIRLRNSTIAEFSFADAVFYKWRQTYDTIWLTVLCAALYREHATEPTEIDNRTPFVKQAVDKRADVFKTLPYKTKLAIAYTYEGCRNHIAATHPFIFPKPIETEETNNQPKPKQRYVSFGEIILDKIGGDPSKLEVTNNVLTYDFLSIYEKDLKDIRKQKK